jgi:hypothetical protein
MQGKDNDVLEDSNGDDLLKGGQKEDKGTDFDVQADLIDLCSIFAPP